MLDRLEAAGVRVVPVKGPVWAQLLYGDVTLRSWADLDLLVAHGQAAKAREVLLGGGLSDCSRWNERMVRSRWGDTGQIALGSRDMGLIVDLHWRLAVSVSPRGLTSDLVLARAEAVDLLGRQVTCPGKTDVFLMTCLEGSRDRWGKVARLLDLAVQIARWPASEWPLLLSAAEAAGCRRRVHVAVAHVCRVLGLETPDAVAGGLEAEAAWRRLVRSLQPRDLSGAPLEGLRARLARVWWQAMGEDHRADRAAPPAGSCIRPHHRRLGDGGSLAAARVAALPTQAWPAGGQVVWASAARVEKAGTASMNNRRIRDYSKLTRIGIQTLLRRG